jgi:hypothetical protein
MTTFTFRASKEITGRISSAQMRAWLNDFLRQRDSLPPDPESGYGRVSLTLPGDDVSAVPATYSHTFPRGQPLPRRTPRQPWHCRILTWDAIQSENASCDDREQIAEARILEARFAFFHRSEGYRHPARCLNEPNESYDCLRGDVQSTAAMHSLSTSQ